MPRTKKAQMNCFVDVENKGTQERKKKEKENINKATQTSVILELFLSKKKCALFGQIALRKRIQKMYNWFKC